MTTSRVKRMLQIVAALQYGRKYLSDDSAIILSSNKRLLKRDIKEVAKIGRHCDYNQRIHSYELNARTFPSAINLNPKEVAGLLETLKKCFSDGKIFGIHEYCGIARLTKPKGQLYNIKLRFSPQVARTVTKIQWHRTQTSTRYKDGSAVIEFRVDGLGEITWWVLSYGNQVQVLAPRILQEKIGKIAANISEYYKR